MTNPWCWLFGHRFVIPTDERMWDPIRCRRCGYEPIKEDR